MFACACTWINCSARLESTYLLFDRLNKEQTFQYLILVQCSTLNITCLHIWHVIKLQVHVRCTWRCTVFSEYPSVINILYMYILNRRDRNSQSKEKKYQTCTQNPNRFRDSMVPFYGHWDLFQTFLFKPWIDPAAFYLHSCVGCWR